MKFNVGDAVTTLIDHEKTIKGSVGVVCEINDRTVRVEFPYGSIKPNILVFHEIELEKNYLYNKDFKAGDRVKFIRKYGVEFFYGGALDPQAPKEGETGTVLFGNGCHIYVKMLRDRWNFHSAELELAPEPVPEPAPEEQFHVGDKVKIVKTSRGDYYFYGGTVKDVPIGFVSRIASVVGNEIGIISQTPFGRWNVHKSEIEKTNEPMFAIGQRVFVNGSDYYGTIHSMGAVYCYVTMDDGKVLSLRESDLSHTGKARETPAPADPYEDIIVRPKFKFGDMVSTPIHTNAVFIIQTGPTAFIALPNGSQTAVEPSSLSKILAGAPQYQPKKEDTVLRKVPYPMTEKPKNAIEQEAAEKGKEKALDQLVQARVSNYSEDTKAYFNILTTIVDYAKSAKAYEKALGITAAEQKKILGDDALKIIGSIVVSGK